MLSSQLNANLGDEWQAAGDLWRTVYTPEQGFIGWAEEQYLRLDY
jgi:hypothetical protein